MWERLFERQGFNPAGRDQHRALWDAHEHIGKADEILGGPKKSARRLLRTIGRLLDETGTPNVHTDRGYSDERTNRKLRVVVNALDIPADGKTADSNSCNTMFRHARSRRNSRRMASLSATILFLQLP